MQVTNTISPAPRFSALPSAKAGLAGKQQEIRFSGGFSGADADKLMKTAKRFALGVVVTLLGLGAGIGVLVAKGCGASDEPPKVEQPSK